MSAQTPMQIGAFTAVAAVTSATAAKALGQTTVQYLNIYNSGAVDAFVNSGSSTISIVFPTTGTGQNGTIIPAGMMATYRKNSPSDTHLATICASGTTTLYIQSGEGV